MVPFMVLCHTDIGFNFEIHDKTLKCGKVTWNRISVLFRVVTKQNEYGDLHYDAY